MNSRELAAFILIVGLMVIGLVLPGGVTAQPPDLTTRVSASTGGAEGNNESSRPELAADGRYIAFDSIATNLVSGDGNGLRDIFVHDWETGDTERVSIDSNGDEANGESRAASISADGRYVAFRSLASDLVSSDSNGAADIFVHDRNTGDTERVSVASGGTQAIGESLDPDISDDGRWVAFTSAASNLVSGDANGKLDIFVHDRNTGQTKRASVTSGGVEGNGDSNEPSVSETGRYVAFASLASNLGGDTNGFKDIFVHDRDTDGDGTYDEAGSISTTRVSVATGGAEGDGESAEPSLSSNGLHVAFSSLAKNLVSGDGNNVRDIFVRDRLAGQTTRVSHASNGAEGNQESIWPSISSDGRYVAFRSLATNLVDDDSNNARDVFVRDRNSGVTNRVSVDSDGGQGNGGSQEPSTSGDGRYVAFSSTASDLVSGDTNSKQDIFVRDRGPGGTVYLPILVKTGP